MPLSNFKISLKELKKVDKWMIISIILITSFGIVNIYLAKKTATFLYSIISFIIFRFGNRLFYY